MSGPVAVIHRFTQIEQIAISRQYSKEICEKLRNLRMMPDK